MTTLSGYTGRFAPSPTGPLHDGSLVAALASWLDARAHGGRWLVRIEDLDTPRCVAGAEAAILAQLANCGLVADEAPQRQSARTALYEAAFERLRSRSLVYPCACSRSAIAAQGRARGAVRAPGHEWPYPGTCRHGTEGPARAWRVRTDGAAIDWHDRRLGEQRQDVEAEVGDFVVRRADGVWAYQLAVVVDDAAQGVTHVVRGEDLADNTPRQLHLQRLLNLPQPAYLHAPLVVDASGAKLSKQSGAAPVDTRDALAALARAARVLQVDAAGATRADWLAQAVAAWPGACERMRPAPAPAKAR